MFLEKIEPYSKYRSILLPVQMKFQSPRSIQTNVLNLNQVIVEKENENYKQQLSNSNSGEFEFIRQEKEKYEELVKGLNSEIEELKGTAFK